MSVAHSPPRNRYHAESVSATKLSSLRRRRTLLRKHFSELDSNIRSQTPADPQAESRLREASRRISTFQREVNCVNQQIWDHPDFPEDMEEDDMEESLQYNEKADCCAVFIEGLLSKFSAGNAATSLSTDSHSSNSTSIGTSANMAAPSPSINNTSSAIVVAAPPPVLDTAPDVYDGDRLNYRLWRSQFENWIKRRTTATGSDRLVALAKFLRGPPRELIRNLSISDANYDVALQLLDSNYGQIDCERKRVLARVMAVPTVRASTDIEGLRKLLNHVQGSVLSMQALGVPTSQYALTYETAVYAALPESVLFEFEDSSRRDQLIAPVGQSNNDACASSGVPADFSGESAAKRIDRLLEYLRQYTNHKEQVALMHKLQRTEREESQPAWAHQHHRRQQQQRYDNPPPRQPARKPPRTKHQSTVAAPVLRQQNIRPCLFCNQMSHRPSRCDSELTYQQRKDVLLSKNRCFVCLARQHRNGESCKGVGFPCTKCNARDHYTALHPPDPERGVATSAVALPTAPVVVPLPLVMTASARVLYGQLQIPVRLLLDTGSMLTFASPQLISQLPDIQPMSKTDLMIQGFANTKKITTLRYRLRLASCRDSKTRIDISAYAYDFDINPPSNCPAGVLQAIKTFGQDHPLADQAYAEGGTPEAPALLIGIDQFYKIVCQTPTQPVTDGLIGTQTHLGWVVAGQTSKKSQRVDIDAVHPVCCAATLSRPARDIERLWTLEAIGIQDPPAAGHSVEEEEAMRQFQEGLSYNGQAYTVPVPKRPSIFELPNNLDNAQHRLTSKRRALLRDPDSFKRYHDEVMAFAADGHAEEVTDFGLARPGEPDGTYYMPHHQVITQADGRQKWRIVFDCSSAARGRTSLNSHLLPGPNLNPDLVKLILNFRLHEVAVSADIARAYMMINIAESDRPLFRFLWQGPDDDHVRCYQLKKVTWGASPSGFLLAATLREIFKRVDPSSTHRLGDSLYHDDMLRSFPSTTDAVAFIENTVAWFGSAGMKLAKWKTNSLAITCHLKQRGLLSDDSSSTVKSLVKVLGIAWSPGSDELHVQLASLAEEAAQLTKITKRSVLRVVASIFDPMGWLLPYTVRSKLLIQQLWAHSLKWDEPIVGAPLEFFKEWANEMKYLLDVRIPRQYAFAGKNVQTYHLHIFGDASEVAYAAVAYLQSLYTDGSSSCTLVMCKSRLAPRQTLTLPRLELMAALLSARLRSFVIDRLMVKIERIYHYTDSTTAYYWCTSEQATRWKTFVCNRVTEIQRITAPEEWMHVPGQQNVADFATRGVSATELKKNSEWWTGPDWLNLAEEDRPCKRLRPTEQEAPSAVSVERRVAVAVITPAAPIIDIDRFSSWTSALRIVRKVLEFVHRCRRQSIPTDPELQRASETILIKFTQRQYFAAELAAVASGERPSSKSPLANFALFIDDDGVLRARTRLIRGSHFSRDEANPIVLPGEARLAKLLILHHHRINAHFGVAVVLSALRRRFWITRARQVIKSILGRCVVCRKAHGAFANQVQAPLPPERTSLLVPFSTTGLDYCGPFLTRSREGAVKSYIALFTCASTRAVHLELVPTMSTPDTHLALRRFLSLYPGCTHIISDNARSFARAASDIKRLFNSIRDPASRELLAERQIKWTFNCPRAPWRGGFFERVVGTVKVALSKTLGRSLISFDELRTVLCEIAATVNNRPITYVSTEIDSPLALTPAQFLHGGPVGPPLASLASLDSLGPTGSSPSDVAASGQLNSALLNRTNYFKSLCSRWRREYLLQLRTANMNGRGRPKEIQVGDVCLLKEDNVSRAKWNLVRILDRHTGRDGAIRTYTVRFANGFETRRAAQLLCPLELVQ